MMYKKIVLASAFCGIVMHASAQVEKLKKAEWLEVPAKQTLTATELKEPHVITKDERIIEMIYDNDGKLREYFTRHRRIKIHEQQDVEKFNKIYLPVRDPQYLYNFNARVVSKAGKSSALSKSEMKEIEEEGQRYMILAVAGLEKEGELEYAYTVEKESDYWGTEILQTGSYIKNSSLYIISPENLVYDSKSYNGYPSLNDTVIDGKNILSASADVITPSNEEKYCNYTNALMRVEYKLAMNTKGDGVRLFTYDEAGKLFYKSYSTLDKDESKAADKFYNTLKVEKLDEENKIRTIEQYIKTNITYEQRAGNNIAEAIKNKYTSSTGLVRLYMALFKKAGIKFEIVVSTNRYDKFFDPDFDSWTYLDEHLVYFPSSGKYLVPTDVAYRYGLTPHLFAGNSGLFIKEFSLGDMVSGIGQIKKIEMRDFSASYDNMYIDIDFAGDMSKVNMHLKRELAGYSAVGVRPAYFYSAETDRKEIEKEILKVGIEDAKVTESKSSNFNVGTNEVEKPFIIEGQMNFTSILEKAGDAYLFKVGAVIGPQVEMYQEKPRQHDADANFPHGYLRKIKIKIPAGYTVKGLDVLKINIGSEADNIGFISDYKVSNDILEIDVNEFYKDVHYPLKDFEKFKRVINGAADFNKLSILFEKK